MGTQIMWNWREPTRPRVIFPRVEQMCDNFSKGKRMRLLHTVGVMAKWECHTCSLDIKNMPRTGDRFWIRLGTFPHLLSRHSGATLKGAFTREKVQGNREVRRLRGWEVLVRVRLPPGCGIIKMKTCAVVRLVILYLAVAFPVEINGPTLAAAAACPQSPDFSCSPPWNIWIWARM